ncbi:hypothetical protein AaE_007144, partial [Aphanomyces astaci]
MAKRTFFEDDNPALFGWHLTDIPHLQPALAAIDDCIHATLTQLLDAPNSIPPSAITHSTGQTSGNPDDANIGSNNNDDDDGRPPLDENDEDEGDRPPHPSPTNSPVHAQSTLCVSMFLALWIAMTHHILRTSRGHIPWQDLPAYRHLHDRGIRLFEKAYTLQTLECDDDSNLVRLDMMLQRRIKVDMDFPIDILYPQVVFATATKIIGLTQSPIDFIAILFKHTSSSYVRAVPACVGHLEHWLTVLPMEVFQEESLHKLLVKHVRKLLMSDRVDRLKSILIFLLHSVGLFDMALQASILLALHDAFDHLFRHWFRDVRFCYHLVLLYLFGDRRQLGSRSDAILLGLDTDIVVLQRHPLWLQFDERLLDALEGCRSATRTTPYDRTSFNEYIGQLEHYYQSAESLPDGEAVPIPRIKNVPLNQRVEVDMGQGLAQLHNLMMKLYSSANLEVVSALVCANQHGRPASQGKGFPGSGAIVKCNDLIGAIFDPTVSTIDPNRFVIMGTDDFRASMDELVLLPTPTISITILCVTLYIVVGMTALYRSVVPRPLPVTRLKAFQYLVAAFSFLRSMSFVSGEPSARNIVNRLALCIFFSLVLFQVFFWFDIVNPGMSVRSKRIWNTFLVVNFVFYTFVLVLQLVSPATPVELDDESRVRINFWSDLLPVLLVALGSVGSAGGMLYLSCKMRLRVQRLVDEVPRQTIQAMHRALAFLNGVLLLSSVVFAMRTVFYLQRPWSHKECGAIQDPNVCIFVGYVLPEMVPCILFLALMQQVDPRLWTSSCHASTSETTPLLRKQPASSLFDTPNHVRWQRPLKSPTTITTPLPPRPSPSALGSPPTPHSTTAASEPALWLSIRCIDLHRDSNESVSTFVVATSIATGSEIGRTEVFHGDNSSPMYYRVLLNVPTLQGALRLQVYVLHDVATLVMEAVVDDPSTLVPGHAMSFRRDEDGAMALPDGLLMIRCEAVSSVEPTFQRLARAFVWPEMTLLAEEELVESPFTWSIPYQLLQVIVVDLADKLDRLTDAATSEIESSLAVATSPREGDEDDGGGNRSLLSDMIFHLQGNKRRR